jgi:hypothetical protein
MNCEEVVIAFDIGLSKYSCVGTEECSVKCFSGTDISAEMHKLLVRLDSLRKA